MVTSEIWNPWSRFDKIWGVRLYSTTTPVHAVAGRDSRVTCCGEHFSSGGYQQALPVTCERCLEQIGCLAGEV